MSPSAPKPPRTHLVVQSIVPVVAGIVQLVAFTAIVVEVVFYLRLVPAYAAAGCRWSAPAEGLPTVLDPTSLQRLDGQTAAVRYRWDAQRRALLFGRRYGVISGERGHLVGVVRFAEDGTPSITWRPAPIGILLALLALGGAGLAHFVLVEGQLPALAGVPVLLLACGGVGAMQWFNAQGTLRRVLLPQLADVLNEAASQP